MKSIRKEQIATLLVSQRDRRNVYIRINVLGKIIIIGTKGNWMRYLAIKEHFVVTPFLIIPFAAAVQALIVGIL